MRKTASFILMAAAAASLAACGGGNKQSSSTTTTTTTTQSSPAASPTVAGSPAASPAASAPAPGASPMRNGAMQLNATPEPIPAKLSCAGQQPVWATARRHVYHVASDPLYGRTKHGQYMCLRDAVNAGYHAAGMRRHNGGGAMASPAPSPAAT